MTITLDTHVTIPDDVFHQDLGGEAVLLEVKSGKYFGLDAVGSRMWNLLVEHKTLQPVYEVLAEEYNVDPERLKNDLLNLVQKLVEKNLLATVDSNP